MTNAQLILHLQKLPPAGVAYMFSPDGEHYKVDCVEKDFDGDTVIYPLVEKK